MTDPSKVPADVSARHVMEVPGDFRFLGALERLIMENALQNFGSASGLMNFAHLILHQLIYGFGSLPGSAQCLQRGPSFGQTEKIGTAGA